jgi:hypothetical protein
MTWSAVRIALLVLALVVSHSVCASACSTVPPCHQQHGVGACDHVLPTADVAISLVPAPLVAVELLASPNLFTSFRVDWTVGWTDGLRMRTALRI